jgi:hypothetical protein
MLTTQSLLTSFINNITLSTRTIAVNGPTPEDQALNYLIVNDTTFNFSQLLELNSMMTNVVQSRIRQRYALLTLWFQQAFAVTKWKTVTGWLVNANECDNWYHITCTSIDLGGTVGMQDVDLGLLAALIGFSVFTNELTGTLPVSIGEWTAMKYFVVYTNELTGTIPASISNWSKIQAAYFDGNKFTGTIPGGICHYMNVYLVADCKSEINCTCCTICY